jgi:hypothetical protein
VTAAAHAIYPKLCRIVIGGHVERLDGVIRLVG